MATIYTESDLEIGGVMNGLENKEVNEITVSIVTPSKHKRLLFLRYAAEMIVNQTVFENQIIEWIIVCGDQEQGLAEEFRQKIMDEILCFFPQLMNRTRIILPHLLAQKNEPSDERVPLNIGYLRNICNGESIGDVIKCHDDDDYYPPQSVQHTIESLKESGKCIAGCSALIMYDVDLNQFYKLKGFGKNHSSNNAMGYTKKYLENHKYNESIRHWEEKSFTNNYNEPMVQLDPYNTLLFIAHSMNTVDKRKHIIINESILQPANQVMTLKKEYTLDHFIHDSTLKNQLRSLWLNQTMDMIPHDRSSYDIVYYCGMSSMWSPESDNLGGSEQAVKHLSEEWVNTFGKTVAVYTSLCLVKCSECDKSSRKIIHINPSLFMDDSCDSCKVINQNRHMRVNGVDYFNFNQFQVSRPYKQLILWRNYGVNPLIHYDLKCERLHIDLHDSFIDPNVLSKYEKKITGNLFFKSSFHLLAFELLCKKAQINPKIFEGRIAIIPNGLRTKELLIDKDENEHFQKRNMNALLYCSCYTRGLRNILLHFWPTFKQLVPDAEFHVCYGMNLVNDVSFKQEMNWLLNLPGVHHHGKVGIDKVRELKQYCGFHFYYSGTLAETDCISIRESVLLGCLPVLSNLNVFGERQGIKIEGDPSNPEDQVKAAHMLSNIINEKKYNEKSFRMLKIEFIHKSFLQDWREIAQTWINRMGNIDQ